MKTNEVTLSLQIAVIPLTPPPGCSVVNSNPSCCCVCLWHEWQRILLTRTKENCFLSSNLFWFG